MIVTDLKFELLTRKMLEIKTLDMMLLALAALGIAEHYLFSKKLKIPATIPVKAVF